MAAVPDVLNLIAGDNPTNYRGHPVIVRRNQSPCAVMQLKRRINQRIGHAMLAELRANGAQDHPLWLCPLNNETPNHHIVVRLHKGANT